MKVTGLNGSSDPIDLGLVFRYLVYANFNSDTVQFHYVNEFEKLCLEACGITNYDQFTNEYNVTQVELTEVTGTISDGSLIAAADDYSVDAIFTLEDKFYKITGDGVLDDESYVYPVTEIVAARVEITNNKFNSVTEFKNGDYVTDGTDLYTVVIE